MRKPRGKASRESHRSLDPHDGKRDPAATAREESTRACPHLRGGLTLQGRLQKNPNIHVSTAEETSGSGPESTQVVRPGHQQESYQEKPPSIWHGDWTFLRRAPPLEMRRERREFFPQHSGKGPSSRARRWKRGSSVCGRTPVLPLEWRRVCRGTS